MEDENFTHETQDGTTECHNTTGHDDRSEPTDLVFIHWSETNEIIAVEIMQRNGKIEEWDQAEPRLEHLLIALGWGGGL